MQEEQRNKPFDNLEEEINILELFNILWQGKWIIISLTTLIAIIGVIYSLSLPNIYTSKALLAPVNQSSSSVPRALGGYAGIAGVAGISLPSGADEGNALKAQKKIKTLSFFEQNILPNIFLPDLMAVESWNPNTKKLIYDETVYDMSSNTWSNEKIPSAQESYSRFKNFLSVSKDDISGFVTVSINHQSPLVAKKWADLIIDEVNAFYRQKDKLESEMAVKYLNQQISMTSLSEIKQVLAQLLQDETQKLTLIEVNEYYVFDFIDPPAVMERKSEPRRSVICIIIALMGGVFSIFLVLARHFFNLKID